MMKELIEQVWRTALIMRAYSDDVSIVMDAIRSGVARLDPERSKPFELMKLSAMCLACADALEDGEE